MTWTLWGILLGASVVISFTPGAGAVNTMTNAINEGWRRSIWGIMGQQIALVVHVIIVAAGVGVIVQSSPVIFNIIRYAGAAYLVYLGIRLIFAPVVKADVATAANRAREGAWSMLRRGFWVNILNPKAIVFFLAFVPQFIRVDRDPIPQYLILIATVVVVDILVMWCFFAVAARPFRRLTATSSGQRLLNRIFGSLFIAVAVLLAVMH